MELSNAERSMQGQTRSHQQHGAGHVLKRWRVPLGDITHLYQNGNVGEQWTQPAPLLVAVGTPTRSTTPRRAAADELAQAMGGMGLSPPLPARPVLLLR